MESREAPGQAEPPRHTQVSEQAAHPPPHPSNPSSPHADTARIPASRPEGRRWRYGKGPHAHRAPPLSGPRAPPRTRGAPQGLHKALRSFVTYRCVQGQGQQSAESENCQGPPKSPNQQGSRPQGRGQQKLQDVYCGGNPLVQDPTHQQQQQQQHQQRGPDAHNQGREPLRRLRASSEGPHAGTSAGGAAASGTTTASVAAASSGNDASQKGTTQRRQRWEQRPRGTQQQQKWQQGEGQQQQQQRQQKRQGRGLQGERQQQQHDQGGRQQQQQQQHHPGPSVCRPVCSPPQASPGVPSVVMELKKLRRQYSASFRFLFRHPVLQQALQQFCTEQEGALCMQVGPAFTGSAALPGATATTRNTTGTTAYMISEGGQGESASANAETEQRASPATKPMSTEGTAEGEGVAASDRNTASSAEGHDDADRNHLCRFELVMIPTDPEFDKTALPRGLALQVCMETSYPGAESVLAASQKAKQTEAASSAPKEIVGNGASGASAGGGPLATPVNSSAKTVKRPENGTPQELSSTDADATLPSDLSAQKATPTPALESSAVNASGSPGPETKSGVHAKTSEPPGVAKLKVCSEEINDFRCSAIELVFAKVIEKQIKMHEKVDIVRTALKAVDRHLREIFELQATPATASQQHQQPWTATEQKKLEEAVVLFRRVADPVLRWRRISGHVGSRSAKECALRFQACRETIMSQRQAAQADEMSDDDMETQEGLHPNGAEDDNSSEHGEEGVSGSSAFAASATPRIRGCDVSLVEPTTEGVSALHLSCVRLQVGCGRCRAEVDMRVALPKDGSTLEPAGCSVDCGKCRLRMGIRIQPVIGVGGTSLMKLATVEPSECLLKDLLPCDFMLTCDCCAASVKAREVLSGAPRTNHCRHCHSKLTFGFNGAALGSSVVCGLGSSRGRDVPRFEAKQQKQDIKITVNTPLANNGTCKHYKKSFRWLRFPCCGKAFPCDVCHDNSEDHEHEWATRMICGFCSVEQPFANGKPCSCGKALTRGGGSAHWEGGKGCRDPTRMSRRDSRKYKLMSKQQQKS